MRTEPISLLCFNNPLLLAAQEILTDVLGFEKKRVGVNMEGQKPREKNRVLRTEIDNNRERES